MSALRAFVITSLFVMLGTAAAAAQEPLTPGRVTDSLAVDSAEQAAPVEKRIAPTSAAVVSAGDLTGIASWRVEQALQGRVPGAMISQNSGAPGSALTVQLRGVSSLFGAFTPFYVIDGIVASDLALPSESDPLSFGGVTALGGSRENAIDRIGDLSPGDIESVEVLRGAAASSIYGAKGASGVVLITTKRGVPGGPRFTVGQHFGLSHINRGIGARRFSSGDTAAIRAIWAQPGVDAFIAANGLVSPDFFDHEMEVVGQTPLSHQTSASVRGGSETTRYFASASTRHDAGIMTRTFADRQGLRFNFDQAFNRISFAITSAVNRIQDDLGLGNSGAGINSPYGGFASTPTFVDLRATCPDGSRRARCDNGTYPVNPFAPGNPLQTVALYQNRETVWHFRGAGWLTVEVVKTAGHSLRLVAGGGTDRYRQDVDVLSSAELQFESLDGLPGTSITSAIRNHNETVSASLIHKWQLTAGTVASTRAGVERDGYRMTARRSVETNLVAGGGTGSFEEVGMRRSDVGLFAEEEILTLNERLLLVAGVRGDRRTRDFEQRYWYPGAGVSFRFPGRSGFLDQLTLRGAAGATGNYGQAFTVLFGPLPPGPGGPEVLKPEREVEIEAGLDAAMFGHRASLDFTVYQKRTTNLLIERSIVGSGGFATEVFNGGSLRARGLEISLSAAPVRTRAVQLDSRISFWMNRCTITSLAVPAFPGVGVRKEQGKSCTQYWGNDSLGGLPGDEALGPIGIRVVRYLVDINPRFNLAFATDLRVRAVRLRVLVDHQNGGYHDFITSGLFDSQRNSIDYVTPRSPGELTGMERQALAPKCSLCAGLRPSGYVKLRELSVGLELPSGLVQRLWSGLRHARLDVTGRNLWTITSYPGTDPESAQTMSSLADGVPREVFAYPAVRSVWFSVEVEF